MPAIIQTATDPVSVVYRAIWSALLGFSDWTNLFPGGAKSNNFLRYDSTLPDPPQRQMAGSPADQPQVIILQGSFTFNVSTNARVIGISQAFPLVIVNRDMQVVPLNQLKWQTFRALYSAGPTLGLENILRGWQIQNCSDDAFGSSMWKKGQVKWQSILAIYCQLYVPNENVSSGVLHPQQ